MRGQLLIMFLVIGGAAVIPFFARKFRIPSATLEIIYGIFLFNSIVTERPEWFSLLKEIGFIYLMFIAGMELDLRRLLRQKGTLWYFVIPAASFVITPLVLVQYGFPFYLGIAVSVVSAGIVIPVFRELELSETALGRATTGVALTGELLSIMVLTGIDIHHRHGLTLMAGVEALKVLLLFSLAALLLRVLYVLAWWHPERVERVMESEDPVEEGIRAVITVAFAGALVAYGSGIEPILGSFMAGLVFSYVFRSKGRFEEKINALGFGFFIPFFFIGVGADFDVSLLGSHRSLMLSLLLAFMIFVSNIYPVFFQRLMGLGGLEALGMSLLLSAPLSLVVVAGALGEKMGLITGEMNSALILAALISSIVYPFLFRLTTRRMRPQESSPSEA